MKTLKKRREEYKFYLRAMYRMNMDMEIDVDIDLSGKQMTIHAIFNNWE